MNPVRLSVAGAGAVVERFHLPAARLCPEIRVVALADTKLERAQALAARFGIAKVTADYREFYDGADGILIALPNFLHAPAAIEFLRRGIPVLVEKPMALGVAEAEEMIQAARDGNTVLAVGLVSRQAAGARWIKHAVAEGLLGSVKSFELEYGGAVSRQFASKSLFSRAQTGGGVLIDLGSHMLDLAVWWMGKPVLLEYTDDARGGLEAECTAILSFAGPSASVNGVVSLSRLRTLTNQVRIVGDRRIVEWDIATDTLHGRSSAGHRESDATWLPPPPRRHLRELFADQLQAFARAVTGLGEATASGESALPVVDLIERCYREHRHVELPWTRPALSV